MDGSIFVSYGVENRGGLLVRTFTVQLVNYPWMPFVDVFIDGVRVGGAVADNNGNGQLVLSTHPTGDELPFPTDFPELGPGSQIDVRSGQMMFNQWIFQSIGHLDFAYVT
jgi:hypothetical protein